MDVLLIETLNGGDCVKKGDTDIMMVSGWQNMVYLAMFGGNVEANTTQRLPGQQSFDWWGNSLLMPSNSSQQFNSNTERTLKDTPLTSFGRTKIQQAVEKDLEFMKEFATIKVVVTIPSTNKVKIQIDVRQPDDFNGSTPDQYRAYVFIWDGTKQSFDGDFSLDDFNNDFF